MIGEFLFNIIFAIVRGMLNLLPDISWDVDFGALSYFVDIVRVVSYLLPMQTVTIIVSLIFSIICFRIVISLIKTIWELLPIV